MLDKNRIYTQKLYSRVKKLYGDKQNDKKRKYRKNNIKKNYIKKQLCEEKL